MPNATHVTSSVPAVRQGRCRGSGSLPPGSLDSAPPSPRVTGLEFVELGVLKQHPLTTAALMALGFRHTGNNREKPIELWEQGDAKILLDTSPVGRGGQSARISRRSP